MLFLHLGKEKKGFAIHRNNSYTTLTIIIIVLHIKSNWWALNVGFNHNSFKDVWVNVHVQWMVHLHKLPHCNISSCPVLLAIRKFGNNIRLSNNYDRIIIYTNKKSNTTKPRTMCWCVHVALEEKMASCFKLINFSNRNSPNQLQFYTLIF